MYVYRYMYTCICAWMVCGSTPSFSSADLRCTRSNHNDYDSLFANKYVSCDRWISMIQTAQEVLNDQSTSSRNWWRKMASHPTVLLWSSDQTKVCFNCIPVKIHDHLYKIPYPWSTVFYEVCCDRCVFVFCCLLVKLPIVDPVVLTGY